MMVVGGFTTLGGNGPAVFGQPDEPHTRVADRFDHYRPTVARPVVDHDQLELRHRLRKHARQTSAARL